MAERQTWRVLHDGNRAGWKVRRPNGVDVPLFTLKTEALEYAKREAREKHELDGTPTQVVVHGGPIADGQILDEFTYGDDPYPPEG